MSGPITVRGVLIGRFRLIDGRPGDTREAIAEMVAAFEPGTVPVLSRHGGLLIGRLDTLQPWDREGLDLAFTGHVCPYPDLAARLRRGVAVSSEQLYPESDWSLPWMPAPRAWRQHFTGRRSAGYQLIGIAVTDAPAARGSFMVADGGTSF
jgi:hypothetical protein